jgi:RimJ/RimL family protein N-acetyltransferase
MSALKRLFNRDVRPRGGTAGGGVERGVALCTERLLLRPVGDGDIRRIAQLAGDWSVASMTARIPFPYTERDAVEWIGGLGEGEVVAAIERDGELIGMVGYTLAPDRRSAEFGYWIGRPYWGVGYATEAARAMVEHCFTTERFDRLTCCHFTDNPASERVIGKLGFTAVGTCSAWSEARRREAPTVSYELVAPARRRRGPAGWW